MAQRNRKYDRQLRVWGEHGQTALEKAHVCVLNCGPTGSESLKNLVLGGIGSFTIVDASKVSASDLGNNYLVNWESMGQPKAKSVCALLQELNESVGAKFVEESPEALLESNPAFFAQFTLVIATQMTEAPLLKLEEVCRQQKVMLVMARSYGLAGLVRLSFTEHDIIESKPENKVEDLRLHKPWPELQRSNIVRVNLDPFQLKLFALMLEIAWLSNAYVALMFAINSILLGAMLIAMRVHQFLNNVKLLVWLSKM